MQPSSRSIELKPLMYQDDRRRQANPAAARTTSEPPLNGIDAEHACSQLVFDTTIDPPRATSVRERVSIVDRDWISIVRLVFWRVRQRTRCSLAHTVSSCRMGRVQVAPSGEIPAGSDNVRICAVSEHILEHAVGTTWRRERSQKFDIII
jgi:hypothetical protein